MEGSQVREEGLRLERTVLGSGLGAARPGGVSRSWAVQGFISLAHSGCGSRSKEPIGHQRVPHSGKGESWVATLDLPLTRSDLHSDGVTWVCSWDSAEG